MYFGGLYVAKLDAGVKTTGAGTEVDLSKSFVEPGKRTLAAILTAIDTVTSDSGSFDYKIQESATTVDSDFTDITGATFTSLTEASTAAPETIFFNTTKRYVRGYNTTAGSWVAAAHLLLTKRDG
jgi:hypothetical protein